MIAWAIITAEATRAKTAERALLLAKSMSNMVCFPLNLGLSPDHPADTKKIATGVPNLKNGGIRPF